LGLVHRLQHETLHVHMRDKVSYLRVDASYSVLEVLVPKHYQNLVNLNEVL